MQLFKATELLTKCSKSGNTLLLHLLWIARNCSADCDPSNCCIPVGECRTFLVNHSTQVSMLYMRSSALAIFTSLFLSMQDHQIVAYLNKTCTSHSPTFCSHYTCMTVDLSSGHEQELLVTWYLARRKSAWYTLMRFRLIKNGVVHRRL